MKPVQVMFDERLLARLDATEEVKRDGRSAVLRRAAEDYLRRRLRDEIDEAYRRAYTYGPGLGDDFAGWADEVASEKFEGLLETLEILSDDDLVRRLAEAKEELAAGGYSLDDVRAEILSADDTSVESR